MQTVTLSDILNYFKDDIKTFSRGEEKYKAQRVLTFRISGMTILSDVQSSMKDASYKVVINLNDAGKLSTCLCECPRGKWLCSHMAAALIYAEKSGVSKTDLPSTWIRHPKRHQSTHSKFDKLFPEKKPDYKATTVTTISTDQKEAFHMLLKDNEITCGMEWLLRHDDDSVSQSPIVVDVSSLITNQNDNEVRETLKLCVHEIEKIEILTRGQRLNDNWFIVKKLRISASNFGRVLRAVRINSFPPSLFKTLCGEYHMDKKDPIIWGNIHEEVALTQYHEVTGHHVRSCGVFLFDNGCLGGSPDGIVTEDCDLDDQGTLEIKCPFKYRFNTIAEAVKMEAQQKTLKTFYLTENLGINREHDYYHQVQGCMYATGLLWCDFAVWTTKDFHVVRVPRDPEWESNLYILENFFFETFFQHCRNRQNL